MSQQTSTRRERRSPHAELVHLLNQRYHREWVRAELLQNELDGMRRSLLWRSVSWLRSVKRWCFPPRLSIEPPLAEGALAFTPREVSPSAGRVSIVIPFRDAPALLRNCLRSLRSTTFPRFEVILVDNGSTDPQTIRLLDRVHRRKDCRVVACPGDFNFSRLCNLGAACATGDYLVFLNNDTEVLGRNWLGEMLRIAADPAVGVVGATLLYPDRTIQHAGLFPCTDGTWVHPHRGLSESAAAAVAELQTPRIVPAVTAACLLLRHDLFQKLGGFDERYPVAFNDVDLCLRVRERGLAVVISPDARLLHYEGLSRGFAVEPHFTGGAFTPRTRGATLPPS